MDALLIYDGACRFCRFGVDVIRHLDHSRSLTYCPFGHPLAEQLLARLPEDIRYESMHVARGESLYSAVDAAREVLRVLPLGRVAIAVGLHRTYPLVARYRWLLGRFSPHREAVVDCGPPHERSSSR